LEIARDEALVQAEVIGVEAEVHESEVNLMLVNAVGEGEGEIWA
jgi:hypothetical protein